MFYFISKLVLLPSGAVNYQIVFIYACLQIEVTKIYELIPILMQEFKLQIRKMKPSDYAIGAFEEMVQVVCAVAAFRRVKD